MVPGAKDGIRQSEAFSHGAGFGFFDRKVSGFDC
jgi:hypothetical protein